MSAAAEVWRCRFCHDVLPNPDQSCLKPECIDAFMGLLERMGADDEEPFVRRPEGSVEELDRAEQARLWALDARDAEDAAYLDDEEYAFGGGARADDHAEELAEREEEGYEETRHPPNIIDVDRWPDKP